MIYDNIHEGKHCGKHLCHLAIQTANIRELTSVNSRHPNCLPSLASLDHILQNLFPFVPLLLKPLLCIGIFPRVPSFLLLHSRRPRASEFSLEVIPVPALNFRDLIIFFYYFFGFKIIFFQECYGACGNTPVAPVGGKLF